MKFWWLVAASLAVQVAGCSPLGGHPAGEDHSITVVTVEHGTRSSVQPPGPQLTAYTDEATFQTAYQRIHAGNLAPAKTPGVDFDREFVVVAHLGTRPSAGYALGAATLVAVNAARIQLSFPLREPAPDAFVAQVVTSPYALVTLPRGAWQAVVWVNEAGIVLAEVPLSSR